MLAFSAAATRKWAVVGLDGSHRSLLTDDYQFELTYDGSEDDRALYGLNARSFVSFRSLEPCPCAPVPTHVLTV